ncbi:MAG: D-alanyl-D-alanine carboxypeptidase [Clostridia bacterium]|nr:D-alanyl-D-alanine carboxypeptidase [Clostridia bacterium]
MLVSENFSRIKKAAAMLTAVFLCLCLCACSGVQENETTEKSFSLPAVEMSDRPSEGEISAKSAVVIEASSGDIIWSKNCDQRLPMASTTKIMTALVALQACDIQKTVKISPLAVGVEGSSVYLYEGEELTMENLLYAMLLESANDAAAAIAIEVGGSISGFADMMNKTAHDLGLENTSFENPHGLDGEDHYTTAKELALIARAAMQNETFRKIVSTYKTTIPLNTDEGARLLINHNKLLRSYEGAIGIKTGFTKKSGRCLVSAAARDGVEYICVTLNAPSDWSDHTRLLDYASSLYELRELCAEGEYIYSLPLINASEDTVAVSNKKSVSVILPRNCENIEYVMELPRFHFGGVVAGDELGTLVIYLDGEIIAETPLRAEYTVANKKNKTNLLEWIASLFD